MQTILLFKRPVSMPKAVWRESSIAHFVRWLRNHSSTRRCTIPIHKTPAEFDRIPSSHPLS
jgi:hypothetical protein